LWLCGLRTISHAPLANFRKDQQGEQEDLCTQLLGLLETARAVVEQMANLDAEPGLPGATKLAERKQVQAEKNRVAEQEQSGVSTSEPEARWMQHGDRWIRPSYNAQIITDSTTQVSVAAQWA